MIYGSVSIKGSYHDNNQDSVYSGICNDCYVLVVSDGLGSKNNSKQGSQAVCDSIKDIVKSLDLTENKINEKIFIKKLHNKWLYKLKDNEINQSYATVLACIITPFEIIAFRLGDGFLSIITSEENLVLYDKKENYFENETDCIYEDLDLDKWEIKKIKNNKLLGAIACSDGIAVVNNCEEDYLSFSKELINSYKFDKKHEIEDDMKNWISNWPGSDDKTIAFIIKEGEKIDG